MAAALRRIVVHRPLLLLNLPWIRLRNGGAHFARRPLVGWLAYFVRTLRALLYLFCGCQHTRSYSTFQGRLRTRLQS